MENTENTAKSKFLNPTSVKDAKFRLRRLRKTLKKYEADRVDAQKYDYDWGVKAADEKISELQTAVEFYEVWIKSPGSA